MMEPKMNREFKMNISYSFALISKDEQEKLTYVFLEELELQDWYAITYLALFGGEIFLFTQ